MFKLYFRRYIIGLLDIQLYTWGVTMIFENINTDTKQKG